MSKKGNTETKEKYWKNRKLYRDLKDDSASFKLISFLFHFNV